MAERGRLKGIKDQEERLIPSPDDELRRELLEESEAIVDRLLATKKRVEEITLWAAAA